MFPTQRGRDKGGEQGIPCAGRKRLEMPTGKKGLNDRVYFGKEEKPRGKGIKEAELK